MIKFFRKIRYNLMEQNKTGKYLKYAIGEIVLVVIGILIALQINNWNENRKIKQTEVRLLKELKVDLEETKVDLLSDIDKCQKIRITTDSIYQKLVNITTFKPVEISINYTTEIPLLFPKLSAYEALQSEGITIISNNKLRKKITDFYQLHLPRIRYVESINENQISKNLLPHLEEISTPNNNCRNCNSLFDLYKKESYKRNTYLISSPSNKLTHMMKSKFDIYGAMYNKYEKLSSYIDDLTNEIDKEIAQNND